MPFQSKSQARACFAKDDPDWNCEEWAAKTDFAKLPEKAKKKDSREKRAAEQALAKLALGLSRDQIRSAVPGSVAGPSRRPLSSAAPSLSSASATAPKAIPQLHVSPVEMPRMPEPGMSPRVPAPQTPPSLPGMSPPAAFQHPLHGRLERPASLRNVAFRGEPGYTGAESGPVLPFTPPSQPPRPASVLPAANVRAPQTAQALAGTDLRRRPAASRAFVAGQRPTTVSPEVEAIAQRIRAENLSAWNRTPQGQRQQQAQADQRRREEVKREVDQSIAAAQARLNRGPGPAPRQSDTSRAAETALQTAWSELGQQKPPVPKPLVREEWEGAPASVLQRLAEAGHFDSPTFKQWTASKKEDLARNRAGLPSISPYGAWRGPRDGSQAAPQRSPEEEAARLALRAQAKARRDAVLAERRRRVAARQLARRRNWS